MTIESVMQWSGAWLLTYAIHSTILLVAATFLAGRKNSKLPLVVRDTVWKAALIGGIATATLQNVAGIRPWFRTLANPVASSTQAAVVAAVPDLNELSDREHAETSPLTPNIAESSAEPVPAPVGFAVIDQTDRSPFQWNSFFLIAWMVGAVVGVLRLLGARFQLVKLLSGRREVTDSELLTALTRLRRQATIDRPLNLSQSADLPTAVALRNEICLPDRVFSELRFEHRYALLAHEVAHVARRDAWWLTISLIIENVFFFQPLNRLARKQLQEVAEFLCDDWAVSNTGRHLTFAECLAEVAGWIVQGGRIPQHAPGFAHHDSRLVQRVERVLAPRSSNRGGHIMTRISVAVATLLVFGFSAPGFARVKAEPASIPDGPPQSETPSISNIESATANASRLPETPERRDNPVAAPNVEDNRDDVSDKRIALDNVEDTIEGLAVAMDDDAPQQDTTDTRVVQSLINALDDEEPVVRREAAQALGELRATAAIPALVNALSDDDVNVRRQSVSALARMRNVQALNGLTTALQDPSAAVRSNSIDAILGILRNIDSGARRGPASQVAPSVRRLLSDPSPTVRRKAIGASAALGLSESVPAIISMLQDSVSEVRSSAAEALGRMEDDRAVPPLSQAIRDSSASVRHAAIRSLARYPSADLVPALTAALRDTNADVREVAASALGRLEDRSAVNALTSVLNDTAADVRLASVRALINIEDKSAVGPMSALLRDPSSDVREMVVRGIGELGDSTSFDAILPALSDSVADVRTYAIRSAARLGGSRAAPRVRPMLQDPNAEVREYAARVLGGLKDQASIPSLIAALSDPEPDVRQQAVRALTEIQSPAAAEGFLDALDDDNSDVREYAVRGLAALNDSRFVDPIINALQDGSSSVRARAAAALGVLRDSRARDALIAATEDPDADVRRAAVRALSRIR